jgi:hypothetical protein
MATSKRLPRRWPSIPTRRSPSWWTGAGAGREGLHRHHVGDAGRARSVAQEKTCHASSRPAPMSPRRERTGAKPKGA